MPVKSLFEIIHKAPSNVNPFWFASEKLQQKNYLEPPSYVLPALVVLGLVHFALFLSCAAIICLPFFQGPRGREKNNWLVKWNYTSELSRYLNLKILGK
ncbi:expressed protein [Phakopsora pachyrhizi]|uniref:Expressed protein n=1 Tax=Phakopsora pachyrhizi TaxID=170000 RepID=A0AAV0AGB4_PHAPC|nr:expressed protein [Phakopsora pachyrhizi]